MSSPYLPFWAPQFVKVQINPTPGEPLVKVRIQYTKDGADKWVIIAGESLPQVVALFAYQMAREGHNFTVTSATLLS